MNNDSKTVLLRKQVRAMVRMINTESDPVEVNNMKRRTNKLLDQLALIDPKVTVERYSVDEQAQAA